MDAVVTRECWNSPSENRKNMKLSDLPKARKKCEISDFFSENAKMHECQQIPIAKRDKRAVCQNRRCGPGNILEQVFRIAELREYTV